MKILLLFDFILRSVDKGKFGTILAKFRSISLGNCKLGYIY